MAKIIIYPDPILFKISTEFTPEQLPAAITIAKELVGTMRIHRGLGLAAPQIGISKRIIAWVDGEEKPQVAINPVIISARGKIRTEVIEGCLSIPNIQKRIRRRKRVITVAAITVTGDPIEFNLQNMEAVIVQHEIDHLDGMTILDKRRKK